MASGLEQGLFREIGGAGGRVARCYNKIARCTLTLLPNKKKRPPGASNPE
jgi:hypothetical protein